jgi:Phosphodiester glycosidase
VNITSALGMGLTKSGSRAGQPDHPSAGAVKSEALQASLARDSFTPSVESTSAPTCPPSALAAAATTNPPSPTPPTVPVQNPPTPAPAGATVTHPFPGVTMVTTKSNGVVVAMVDLNAPGTAVRAGTFAERRQTTQQWLKNVGAQIAINGDYFNLFTQPAYTWVVGRAEGKGQPFPADSQNRENRPYLEVGPGLGARIVQHGLVNAPDSRATEIMGGHNMIVADGQFVPVQSPQHDGAEMANVSHRTGLGVSEDGSKLYLICTNTPMNAYQLAHNLVGSVQLAHGAPVAQAFTLDHDGSTQLAMAGRPDLVFFGASPNAGQRPVMNNLGIIATGHGPAVDAPTHP